MRATRQGSATAAVVGIVAIVVVGLVVWYFVSDPFRTKVDSNLREATTWTPKRIAEDPVNYLNFCEEKANKALQELKAAEISIAQSQGTIENAKKDASGKVDAGKEMLKTLKVAYEKGAEASTWPIQWNNSQLTKEAAELQIVTLFKGFQAQQERLTSTEAQIKKLEAQKLKIMSARAETQQQLEKIKTGRETLKVQKITDDLANQLASVQAVLTTTIDAATDTRTSIKTLDQLANESAPKASNADVKAILDQIK
jgi:hypothetical protein